MSFEIIRSRIFGLKPVGREDLVSDQGLYGALFPDHGRSKTYAFIDGARVPDLEERLEAHPGKAVCLDGRRDSHETVWSLPWLVEIGTDDRITRNLLSDHPIRGMWNAEPGLFMETTMAMTELMRHLRKFHRPMIGEATAPIFLRYWEPELLIHLVDMTCGHIMALPKPDLRIIARFDDEAHVLTSNVESPIRPGRMTPEEAEAVGFLLFARRRRSLAEKIARTFPDEVSHLTPRALEREVHDAWHSANEFRLKDGRVRAKFIILAVATAPGIHREPAVRRMFAASHDPERSFMELDSVIQRRIGNIPIKEVI